MCAEGPLHVKLKQLGIERKLVCQKQEQESDKLVYCKSNEVEKELFFLWNIGNKRMLVGQIVGKKNACS